MSKTLTFGDMVKTYRIIGMSNEKVMAKSETAPSPYAVWYLDHDKCGVWGGHYCSNYNSAQEAFLS